MMKIHRSLMIAAVAALAFSVSAISIAAPPDLPREALHHRAELTRNAHMAWGLDAPIAAMAAQIHQESGWKTNVRSPINAQGMAQFMPATSRWIASITPALAANEPDNPVWAMRALATYDKWLWDRIKAADECQRMAMALSAYNGGLGWVYRDQKLALSTGLGELTSMRWFKNGIEPLNAGRSMAAWKENRDYPRRILLQHQPRYVAAGFGKGVC